MVLPIRKTVLVAGVASLLFTATMSWLFAYSLHSDSGLKAYMEVGLVDAVIENETLAGTRKLEWLPSPIAGTEQWPAPTYAQDASMTLAGFNVGRVRMLEQRRFAYTQIEKRMGWPIPIIEVVAMGSGGNWHSSTRICWGNLGVVSLVGAVVGVLCFTSVRQISLARNVIRSGTPSG
jgi:hypothetical protein